MRETVLTLAAATLCAAFLQVVGAQTQPAPPPPHGGPVGVAPPPGPVPAP